MNKKMSIFLIIISAFLLLSGCSKPKKINTYVSKKSELCEDLIAYNKKNESKKPLIISQNKQSIGPFDIFLNDNLRESISLKDGTVLIKSADTIGVENYNGEYYIFENFTNKKFDQAAIYLYKNGDIHEVCSLRKDIKLVAKDCYNEDLCEFVINNSKFFYTKKKDMLVDLNNDGLSEQLTFTDKHEKNECDYETYIINKSEDDVISYLTKRLDHYFDKCFRSISFVNYGGLNYLLIENFEYEVSAFLIRDDRAYVAGTFDPQIELKRIK